MKYTIQEYYNKCFDTYYIMLDNKGNMLEGKGIIPYGICKETERLTKDYITKRRKTDLYVEVLYSKERKEIAKITIISKGKYNKVRCCLQL